METVIYTEIAQDTGQQGECFATIRSERVALVFALVDFRERKIKAIAFAMVWTL